MDVIRITKLKHIFNSRAEDSQKGAMKSSRRSFVCAAHASKSGAGAHPEMTTENDKTTAT
jgi:hypothetical protein